MPSHDLHILYHGATVVPIHDLYILYNSTTVVPIHDLYILYNSTTVVTSHDLHILYHGTAAVSSHDLCILYHSTSIEGYPKSYVQCYIDGSATKGTKDGGYGFTIKRPTDEANTDGLGPVGILTCSFECEKTALVKCIETLMVKHREGMQFPGVVFLSDSQALLQVLGGHLSATISDSMLKLEELRTIGIRVLAQWMPSHVDIKGNEDAGKLANRGRASEQPVVPATFADCKAAIRRGLAELWEAAFRDYDDNSISEVWKLALRIRDPQDPIEPLPRRQAVQVFRMRAEHTLLRGSMFRTKWTPEPSCRLCGFVVESTPHVLFSCPALEVVRDPSMKQEGDLAMFLLGTQAQLKAAASLIEIFLKKVK